MLDVRAQEILSMFNNKVYLTINSQQSRFSNVCFAVTLELSHFAVRKGRIFCSKPNGFFSLLSLDILTMHEFVIRPRPLPRLHSAEYSEISMVHLRHLCREAVVT